MNNLKKISIAISLSVLPIFYANSADDQSQELKTLIGKYETTNSEEKNNPQKINEEQQAVEKKKMELWKEYLRAKEETEAKKNGVIVSQGNAKVEPSTPEKNSTEESKVETPTENDNSESSITGKRFTCVVVSNVKGAQLNEKRNFELHEDSMPKSLVFAIENQDRTVYVNDGMNFPFLRFKPNILQRYIPFMEKNEIVETWIFDPESKKALFSQLKTGEDIGNSGKMMVGDISKMTLSDDCNQEINTN